jgi:hypothetical protein
VSLSVRNDFILRMDSAISLWGTEVDPILRTG